MIKAAVIGVGAMGSNHVRVYADIDGVELVALAEPESSMAERLAHRYRVARYDDYREMLDRESPDIVSVVVPTKHHAEVAREVIARDIHLLVEKPIAPTVAEAMEIIDAAAVAGVKLMVGHVERFNPAIVEIKNRLESNALGRVFQVHARRLSPFPDRIHDVGVVLDLATHDIDAMHFLIGADVDRVFAETERKAHATREDLLSGIMRFENGVIGVLDVNWLTPTKVRQLSVTGEGGMFVADYLTQDLYWHKNSRASGDWDSLEVFRGPAEGDVVKLHLRKQEPLRGELEAFVACVVNDLVPPVTGEDGIFALDVAEKLVQSGHSHTSVPGLRLRARAHGLEPQDRP